MCARLCRCARVHEPSNLCTLMNTRAMYNGCRWGSGCIAAAPSRMNHPPSTFSYWDLCKVHPSLRIYENCAIFTRITSRCISSRDLGDRSPPLSIFNQRCCSILYPHLGECQSGRARAHIDFTQTMRVPPLRFSVFSAKHNRAHVEMLL